MSDLKSHEELVERYVREGNNDEAINTLLFLITKYAQQRDFDAAEALRERIISIDPMALSEAIQAQEIIDSTRMKPTDTGHMEVWAELYERLTVDEANSLYNDMEEVMFKPGQMIFEQGRKNSNLYFIDSGVAKYLYKEGKREMFIKKITAGSVAGMETFFDAGHCTSSLVALDQVKVRFLPAEALKNWAEGGQPALEPKLRDFCDREEKVYELLSKNAQDRRHQRRVTLPGRILIKIVNKEGKPVGKTLRGDMGDVSVGGISFYVQANSREQAQMLLGHDLYLRFNMPPNMKEVERIAQVLAVRHHSASFEEKDQYSLHMKFDKGLAEKSIIEAAKFIRMINATQH